MNTHEFSLREIKLQMIWKKTHRDFKGKVEGKRSILVNREGATCLVPLTDLTDEEIERRL
jgi:hypothetical protein